MSSSPENTLTVIAERTFSHSPEKLWRALTQSPLIAQWLLSNDFELVLERKFQFRAEPMRQWDGVEVRSDNFDIYLPLWLTRRKQDDFWDAFRGWGIVCCLAVVDFVAVKPPEQIKPGY